MPATTSVAPISFAQVCAGERMRRGSSGRPAREERAGVDGGLAEKDIHLRADEELMQLVSRGDPRAFEMIYDRHGGAAYSLAYRIVGKQGAPGGGVEGGPPSVL